MAKTTHAINSDNLTPTSPDGVLHGSAWLDLMAQMSHDLRTPLNAVIGFSDVMSTELLGPVGNPRYREYANDIRDSGRRLLKTAEDTLAMTSLLARSAQQAPQPIYLGSLTRKAWTHFAKDAGARNLAFSLSNECEDLEVLAPELPLRQALVNLLAEAISRTADGGTIQVAAIIETDSVRLEVIVRDVAPKPMGAPGSLGLCLARALLNLQGSGLIEYSNSDGTWRAVTMLDRALQQDFFERPCSIDGPRASSLAGV